MLGLLPHDLVHCILEDWVDDLKSLVSLDVAVCNHALRDEMLLVFQLIKPQRLEKLPEPVSGCAHWLCTRRVMLEELDFFECDELEDLLEEIGPNRTLRVGKLSILELIVDPIPLGAKTISSLFSRFADVRDLSCDVDGSRWFNAAPENIDCVSIVLGMMLPFGSSLRELSCCAFDDQALKRLPSVCPHLHVLEVSGVRLQDPSNLSSVCAAFGDQLEELRFTGQQNRFDAIYDDSLMLSITRACPRLKKVVLGSGEGDDYGINFSPLSIQYLLDGCHHIQHIEFADAVRLCIVRNTSGQRVFNLKMDYPTSNSFICDVIRILPSPLTAFQCSAYFNTALRLIGDKFGNDLMEWRCIGEGLLHDLQYFLQKCPNLVVLYLDVGASDDILLQLPLCCPNVIDIELRVGEDSSTSLSIMLEAYSKRQLLKRLSIPMCLTDEVLVQIADWFPDLEILTFFDSPVSAGLLLDLILSGRLRVQTLQCSFNEWLRERLQEANFANLRMLG